MNPSRRRSGDSSSARSGGTIVTWLHMHEKFSSALGPRALERQRGRGRGRLEPDREEHDLAVGVLLGDPQRVERRVDHPDVGAGGLGVEQAAVRSRDAHHVAEAGEDHAVARGRARSRRRPVPSGSRTPGSRGRARARRWPAAGRRCRTCRSSGCGRRTPPSTCSGGRARPATGSRRPRRGRARRRGTRRRTSRRRSGSSRASAVPAWTSSRSPGATGSTSAISTVARSPSSSRAQRQPALLVDPQTVIGIAVVAAGDAVLRATGGAGSAATVTRSRSPSAPRAPARSPRPSARADRGSRAPPPRRPSRSRSRRGSGPSPRARRPRRRRRATDVDVAADSRDVDLGQPLTSSTISMICPGIARHTRVVLPLGLGSRLRSACNAGYSTAVTVITGAIGRSESGIDSAVESGGSDGDAERLCRCPSKTEATVRARTDAVAAATRSSPATRRSRSSLYTYLLDADDDLARGVRRPRRGRRPPARDRAGAPGGGRARAISRPGSTPSGRASGC